MSSRLWSMVRKLVTGERASAPKPSRSRNLSRRAFFEPLESRHLLAASVNEGSTATITWGTTASQLGTHTLSWVTVDDSATSGSGDYTHASGSIVVNVTTPTQPLSITATVATNSDTAMEPHEKMKVHFTLTKGGQTVASENVELEIKDMTPNRLRVIGSPSVKEGKDASFEIKLDAPARGTVTGAWRTNDGTATAGTQDYEPQHFGTFTIAAGQTSTTVKVKTLTDNSVECDETFEVKVNSAIEGGFTPPVDRVDDSETAIIAEEVEILLERVRGTTAEPNYPEPKFGKWAHYFIKREGGLGLAVTAALKADFGGTDKAKPTGNNKDYQLWYVEDGHNSAGPATLMSQLRKLPDAAGWSIDLNPFQTTYHIYVQAGDDGNAEGIEEFSLAASRSGCEEWDIKFGKIYDAETDEPDRQKCGCGCGCDCGAVSGTADIPSGRVEVKFLLPGGGSLTYRSDNNPHPVIAVDHSFSATATTAQTVQAKLKINGDLKETINIDPASLTLTGPRRIAIQTDFSTLDTQHFEWEIEIVEQYATYAIESGYAGVRGVINDIESPFGNRWRLSGLDRIIKDGVGYAGEEGVMLTTGEGNRFWFELQADGSYALAKGDMGMRRLEKYAGGYRMTTMDHVVSLFNAGGFLTSVTDPNGNETLYTYNGEALATITDPVGRVTTFVYVGGVLSSIIDPHGRVSTFENVGGRLTKATLPDPDGTGPSDSEVTTFAYDPVTGLMTSFSSQPLTGGPLDTTTYTYRPDRSVQTITHPDGDVVTYTSEFAYGVALGGGLHVPPLSANAVSTVTVQTSPGVLRTTTYKHDKWGNVVRETNALGEVAQWVRDGMGMVIDAIGHDPDGAGGLNAPVTHYTYDTRGNVSRIDHADGSNEQWVRETTWNQVVRYTNRKGQVTVYTIDAANGNTTKMRRVVGTEDVGASPVDDLDTSFEYTVKGVDAPIGGLLKAIIDPRGVRTAFEYDARGNLTFTRLAVGTAVAAAIQNVYGATGADRDRVIQTRDELGRTTDYYYDNRDWLTSVHLPDPDGAGPAVRPIYLYGYDRIGRLVAETDPLGRVTTYTYNPEDQVTTVARPRAAIGASGLAFTLFTYNVDGSVVQSTDAIGRQTVRGYDLLGRNTSVLLEDPDGTGPLAAPLYVTAYDPLNRVVSATDGRGNTTNYSYQNFWRDTYALGPVTAGLPRRNLGTVRDANGNVARLIDLNRGAADPFNTVYTYDDLDRLISVAEPDPDLSGPLPRRLTTFAYDGNGNVIRKTDTLGRVSDYVYDARNRLIYALEPDLDGNAATVGDRRVTRYAYDAANQLIETEIMTTGANGTYVPFKFSAWDNPKRWTFTYDGLGRRTSMLEPDPDGIFAQTRPLTTYVYDVAGRMTSTTNALGHVTTYAYDNHDNLVSVTLPDPDGAGPLAAPVTTYVYDDVGQLLSETDAVGRTTTYAYDTLGRRVSVTRPDPDAGGPLLPRVTTYAYDADNNVTSVTESDPDGSGPLTATTTTHTYDTMGRRTSTTDAKGGVTTFAYDVFGNLLQLTDSVGNDTTWTYDLINRPLTETNELGLTRTFSYNAAGKLARRIDRNGRVMDYTYDAMDRLIRKDWRNAPNTAVMGVQSFGYFITGEMEEELLANAGNYDLTLRYSYDGLGRKINESSQVAGLPTTAFVDFAYAYNAVGSRVSTKTKFQFTTNDFQTDYTYDNLQRVTSIRQQGQSGSAPVAEKRVDFAYNDAGQYTTINRFANVAGTQAVAATAYAYDAQGRLTQLAHTQGATNLGTYAFGYDNQGRITSRAYTNATAAWNNTIAFTHDATNQLTGADHSSQADESYTYDANGNRVAVGSQAWTVGANNRILNDGTYTYTYDNEGNRTRRTEIATGAYTQFTYDHNNRLTRVEERTVANVVTKRVDYIVDAYGRIHRRRVDPDGAGSQLGTDTWYFHDGEQIALQFERAVGSTANPTLTHRYLWGPGTDQLLADEAILTPGQAGETRWTLGDQLGTIADIATYAAGVTTIANHRAYDSFGRLASESNAAVDVLFGYTGRLFDDETQLQYNWNRWYDPRMGQWLSEDPIGFAAGDANLRRYVGNGVLDAVDPEGLEPPQSEGQAWHGRRRIVDAVIWDSNDCKHGGGEDQRKDETQRQQRRRQVDYILSQCNRGIISIEIDGNVDTPDIAKAKILDEVNRRNVILKEVYILDHGRPDEYGSDVGNGGPVLGIEPVWYLKSKYNTRSLTEEELRIRPDWFRFFVDISVDDARFVFYNCSMGSARTPEGTSYAQDVADALGVRVNASPHRCSILPSGRPATLDGAILKHKERRMGYPDFAYEDYVSPAEKKWGPARVEFYPAPDSSGAIARAARLRFSQTVCGIPQFSISDGEVRVPGMRRGP